MVAHSIPSKPRTPRGRKSGQSGDRMPIGVYNRLSNLKRFWQYVSINQETGCWEWTAGRSQRQGYGKFWADGKTGPAHRWLYQRLRGTIDSTLTLDHLCRNPACVNPLHLEVVTAKENVLRGVGISAQNARKTRCIRGHKFDRVNTDGSRACNTCARDDARRRLNIAPKAFRV